MKKNLPISKTCWKIMKITFFQLLLAVSFVGISLARDVRGQEILNRTVTIVGDELKLKFVLSQIEKQTNVKFVYSTKIKSNQNLTLNVSNRQLSSVLEEILRPISISYEVIEDRILLKNGRTEPTALPKAAQPLAAALLQPVGGTVLDQAGLSLPGVSILIKGTQKGTTTNANGKYSIEVSEPNAVLVFSFVGYLAQEVKVGNKTQMDVTLTPEEKSLNEVVVIGFGTQDRKDISGAVGSLKASDISSMAVTGADQAMQGKMAGVNITSNDGSPGGSTKVTIRGIGSLNNTDPLYVIDGVMSRQGLTNIAPSDIETIDVLKDASSAAIYGLQGANGVVIITTKRGKNGKTRMTFDTYTGVSTVARKLQMVSPQQYAEWNNESVNLTNVWRKSTGNTELIPLNPALSNPASISGGTDWQNEVFRPAKMEDYQLGFSGGNDKSNYSVSLGYRNQQGVIPSSEYKRYNSRFNIDHRATDFLKVGASFSYTFNRTRGVQTNNLGGGVVQYTMLYSPLLSVFQPGYPGQYSTIPSESLDPNNKYYYAYVPNPFSVFSYNDQKTDATNLYANIYGEVKLPFGITYKSQFGLYTYGGDNYSWTRLVDTPWDPAGANRGRNTNGIGVSNYNGYGYNWDNTLNFTKQIGNHNFNVTAGMVAQLEHNYGGPSITQTQFISEAVPYLGYGNPATTGVSTTNISEVSLYGILGRVIYAYKSRYLFTANIRRDQSSRFASGLNTAVFPSASVAWRISEEPFMKAFPAISDLKLRVGWGKIGNQNGIPAYPTYNLLGSGQDYNLNGVLVSGVATTGLGNSVITWEKTTSTNIGLDLSLFNNSVLFTADYYVKDNSQILLQLPIVATGGVGIYPTSVPGPAQNVGRIKNTGLELSATYRKQIKDFNFSVTANGTFNKNEILNLGGSDYLLPPNIINQLGDYVSRFAVGQSIGAFYGYQVAGIYQNQAEVNKDNEKAKAAGRDYYQLQHTAPGDYKYKDVNNDGYINSDDRTIIGNPNPKFIYGLSLNSSYKSFDFTATLQGISGVDIFNALAYRTEASYFSPFNRTKRAFEQRWQGEGTSTTYPRIIYDDPNINTRISSRYIENGSYLRVRNIQIGYSLPKSITAKLKMERLRVYVAGQNLFTFTKYGGLDPEAGVGQREGNPNTNYDLGIDRGIYPQSRTIMVGLNVSF